MRIQIIFPCVLILSAWACKKPADSDASVVPAFNEPVIFYTSLRDTIPVNVLNKLNISNVNGIKVKYPSGKYSSYFEYEADHSTLIHTIGSLPFSIFADLADTTCHPIPFENIDVAQKQINNTEWENSASFWTASAREYVAYECIKPPYKHTLLLNKNTLRVLHRIEFAG